MPARPFLLLLMLLLWPAGSEAKTALRLAGRIQIDGFTTHAIGPADTSEWRADEKLFGLNSRGTAEESSFDSKWGSDNDVQQIRVTWDKDTLYVGIDAVISGNNVLVWLDVLGGRGLPAMGGISSWRRGFAFSGGFGPDLFGATWDGNAGPHLIIDHPTRGFLQVDDLQSGSAFRGSATFSGNLRGRAMEFAIPWNTVFLGTSDGPGVLPVYVPSLLDSVRLIPPGSELWIAAAITAGNDGAGGPDTAPDKTGCHVSDANQAVTVDNYVILPLDLNDDTGLNGGLPDGIPDWDISPRSRVRFHFEPPLPCKPLEHSSFDLDRPAIAPHRGETAPFHFEFKLRLDPTDPADRERTVTVFADVYDLRGRKVRDLFFDSRPALDQRDPCLYLLNAPCSDLWDGRDQAGRIVPPGVYVIRLVMTEPFNTRLTRPVVVVQ